MFNDFICRSLSAIIQGVTPIFKDVNHINPADNMPAMVVYILFSEIVISCEYIPLVDIIPIISHRRKSLEQLNVIAAVYKIIHFFPKNHKRFFRKVVMPSIESCYVREYIKRDNFSVRPVYHVQEFNKFSSLLRILDTDKAWGCEFHTISPIRICKPLPTGFDPMFRGRKPCR